VWTRIVPEPTGKLTKAAPDLGEYTEKKIGRGGLDLEEQS